jgi:acyl dehydratase
MIDRRWIGHELPLSVLQIERGRLRFFAKAIGETDPVYLDTAAAQAAGYRDIPAPITFLFSAEFDSGAVARMLAELPVPIEKLLHGEQAFRQCAIVCAGDTVSVRSVITDIYEKRNGALEFIVKSSTVSNQLGELVAELRSVLICRH